MDKIKKISDVDMGTVIGGFDKSKLSEKEIVEWHKLIANVEGLERDKALGKATQQEVDLADEQLLNFIRNMMNKYDMGVK